MHFTIGLGYDIFLVAVLFLVAFSGKRRGFLSGLLGLAGSVAGLLGGVWATRAWAPILYNDYLGVELGKKISATLEASGGDLGAAVQQLTFLPQALRDVITQTVQTAGGDLAPQVVSALEPILLPLIQAVVFFVVCLLVRGAFRLVASWLRHINGVPLLGTVNQALGFAFGFVTGALDCWLICLLLWLAASITAGQVAFLTPDALGGSYIYTFLANYNPFLVR